MKQSVDLHELIQSMSKNEKRYFILNSSFQKGNKIYLELFKILERQKIYDEEAIKEKYKDRNFIRHFAFNKNHLYGLVMKSLISYGNQNNIDGIIHSLISECMILFRKGLYKRYFRTIAKAKLAAIKHERYGYLIQLLDMEKIIIPKEEIQKNKINEIFSEAKGAAESVLNLFEYSRLAGNLLNKFRYFGLNRDESHSRVIDEITGTDIMSSPSKAKSIRALEAYYRVRELSAIAKADNEMAYDSLLKRNEIVQKNPEPFENYIIHYPSDILYSLTESCISLGKLDDAEKFLNDIKFYSPKYNSDKEDIDTYSGYAKLRILLKRGLVSNAAKLIPHLERSLKKYENKMLIDTDLSIRYYIVRCRIEEKNFQKALKAANELMHHPYISKRSDYECYIKILNLIIHFELENYSLLKYLIISTYRFLYKREKLFKVEQLILEFIRKLPEVKNNDDLKFMFSLFGKKLSRLRNDKYEKNAFEYFDILKWAESKAKEMR
ncbi:MAG: hypothetical protein ACHQIH_03475 [Ignavibacteria bacterium]